MQLPLSAFFSSFLTAVNLYYPEIADPNLKPPDTAQSELNQQYDFIIVGAGSAGSVVANRLTENPAWKVLLIEAGADEDPISKTPFLCPFVEKSEKDWNYTTVRQKNACLEKGGSCRYPRGRVMGGSSSINYMVYARGNKEDYEEWERAGNIGWGYKGVLPYFIKAENIRIPSLKFSSHYGTSGPLSVQHSQYQTGTAKDFIKAAEQIGFRYDDYNNMDHANVVSDIQYTIKGPSRHSTSTAYIEPIKSRENLKVIKKSQVKNVLIQENVAKGVEYIRDGRTQKVYAKEVILSAGAIDTPKLLMLSGIGPKEELEEHGIPVKRDLPVGKTLRDHVLVSIYFEIDNATFLTPEIWRTNESIIEYTRKRGGPLSVMPAEVHSFYNPIDDNAPPTIQHIYATGYSDIRLKTDKKLLWGIVGLVKPKSTGTLRLNGSDYRNPPLIDPNYLSAKTDVEHIKKGIEKLFEFVNSPAMKKYSPKLSKESNPECKNLPEDKFKECVIHHYSSSYFHPIATARMGPIGDKHAVVSSSDLKVWGIENLRVIDASIMPDLPRGNTNAPTIMIAEKTSDIIKQNYKYI